MQNTSNFDSKLHIFAIFIFAAVGPLILMAAPVIAQQVAIEWSLSPSQVGTFFLVELGVMSTVSIPAYLWVKKVPFRKAALYATILFTIGNILSIFAKSFEFLLIARFIAALGGGTIMIITITSCSLTSKAERTYGFWMLGQVILSALTLFFLPKFFFPYFGLKSCFILMLLVTCIALPFHRYFADYVIQRKSDAQEQQKQNSLLGWVSVLSTFLFYVAIGGVWTFMSSIGSYSKIDQEFTNSILAISTLVGIIGCFLPTIIGDKINRKYFLMIGYTAFIISLFLLLNKIDQNQLMISILLFKFIWMFTVPFVLATVSFLDGGTGKLMNTVNLVVGGGLAIGPYISGQIIESTNNFNPFLMYTMGMFVVSFIMVYCCNIFQRNQLQKL